MAISELGRRYREGGQEMHPQGDPSAHSRQLESQGSQRSVLVLKYCVDDGHAV